MVYTDLHRALVQSFLASATMTGPEVQQVLAALLKAQGLSVFPSSVLLPWLILSMASRPGFSPRSGVDPQRRRGAVRRRHQRRAV